MDDAERDAAEGDAGSGAPLLDTPPLGNPLSGGAAPDSPAPDSPGSDSPAPDSPGLDSPSSDSPSSETPSADSPSATDPSADDPSADGPPPERQGSDDPLLDHDGPWSEEDYRTLTAKGIAHGDGRAELIDGALVVGPGPTAAGDRAVARTRAALDKALPERLCVVGPVALRMGADCVLVPDLVVMRTPAEPDAAPVPVVDAEEVLMVVEVVGQEHGAVDRSFKPQIYARARLPYLLLVDHHTPFAAANMVISGRYHEYARARGAEMLELDEPFRLRMPLSDE